MAQEPPQQKTPRGTALCEGVGGQGFDRKLNLLPEPTKGTVPRRRQAHVASRRYVGDVLDPCPVRRPLAAGGCFLLNEVNSTSERSPSLMLATGHALSGCVGRHRLELSKHCRKLIGQLCPINVKSVGERVGTGNRGKRASHFASLLSCARPRDQSPAAIDASCRSPLLPAIRLYLMSSRSSGYAPDLSPPRTNILVWLF